MLLKDLEQGVPPLYQAIKDLKKGEFTATPLKNGDFYGVYYVNDSREVKVPSFDEMKGQIAGNLQAERIDRAVGALLFTAQFKPAKIILKTGYGGKTFRQAFCRRAGQGIILMKQKKPLPAVLDCNVVQVLRQPAPEIDPLWWIRWWRRSCSSGQTYAEQSQTGRAAIRN